MFSDKVYQIAFLVSLITHGVILLKVANINTFDLNKNEQKMEVSYIKTAESQQKPSKNKSLARQAFTKLPSKIAIEKRTPPPFANKESMLRGTTRNILSDSALTKPSLVRPDVIAIKKKITLPPIGIDKMSNPSYIGYYQIVREKIRRAAYQNYARTETGEVYLSFIVSNEGFLKEVRLVDDKSSSSAYLREIALRSINEASPFPNFPKELDYPQLSFNVVISFEVEQ